MIRFKPRRDFSYDKVLVVSATQKEDYAAMKDLMAQYTSMQTAAANNASPGNGNDDVIDTDFSSEK